MATTAELLKRVKAATLLPTHQTTYTDTDILDIASEEMGSLIVPEIMSLREEFFMQKTVIPCAVGVSEIPIPERAVGRTIRALYFLPTNATEPVSMPLLPLSDNLGLSLKPGVPKFHTFVGDKIVVNPVPDQIYGSYILYWEARPSKLVLSNAVGVVSYVTADTLTVQQNLTSIVTGSTVDVIQQKAGYSPIYMDIAVGSASTGYGPKILTLTGFSLANPITGVVVGDHVSLAWTTDIVCLPDEAVTALVQAIAVHILQGMDLPQQLAISEKRLAVCMDSMKKALSPRNEASSYKIRPKSPMFGPGRRNSIVSTSGN